MQYHIAEKHLSIISNPPVTEEIRKQEDRLKEMQERLEKLEAVYSEKLKIKELGISVEKET
jgi:cell shape-determining protein MreC